MEKKIVHLGVYDTMADWEVGHATTHIRNGVWHREPGRHDVVTVGKTLDPVITMGGVRVVPDVTLDRLAPGDSAMLILPGASAWDEEGGAMAAFAAKAREFLGAGVPVAAICGATAGLAREGLLDDRSHTSSAAEYLQYQEGYGGAGRYLSELAVTDGDLITAGSTAPVEFAREILGRLDVYPAGVLDAWYRLFAKHDASAYAVLAAQE